MAGRIDETIVKEENNYDRTNKSEIQCELLFLKVACSHHMYGINSWSQDNQLSNLQSGRRENIISVGCELRYVLLSQVEQLLDDGRKRLVSLLGTRLGSILDEYSTPTELFTIGSKEEELI